MWRCSRSTTESMVVLIGLRFWTRGMSDTVSKQTWSFARDEGLLFVDILRSGTSGPY
jgi:hypothetical protein